MADLITRRSRVRAAKRERRIGRFARIRERGTNRRTSRGGPAVVMVALLAACGLGALAEYFFDRQHGARRRHRVHDRARGALRRCSHDAVRRAKYLEGVAVPGVGAHKEPPDDVTLVQKVESTAFRKAGVPKGHVSVNAENAVVYLRGQLEREEQIDEVVRATEAIDGVNGVKNLLHTRPTTTGGC